MSIESFVTDARSIITVVSLATFVGIMLWAWSARRADAFAEAANLPFADDSGDGHMSQMNKAVEKHHG